jgi:hypothetical protein
LAWEPATKEVMSRDIFGFYLIDISQGFLPIVLLINELGMRVPV